jgi:hypothetical protein
MKKSIYVTAILVLCVGWLFYGQYITARKLLLNKAVQGSSECCLCVENVNKEEMFGDNILNFIAAYTSDEYFQGNTKKASAVEYSFRKFIWFVIVKYAFDRNEKMMAYSIACRASSFNADTKACLMHKECLERKEGNVTWINRT